MKNKEISNEKVKDVVIFILLLFWIIIPVFQSFFITFKIISKIDYSIMQIIGIAGISFFVYYIYTKLKEKVNKKELFKELLPIIFFLLYMIWTLIACFFSPNKNLAFYGHWYRQEGYITYITYAGFFLCAFLLNSKKLRKALLNIFIIVSLFLMFASRIYTIFPKLMGIFMLNLPTQSVFWQFNHYGYYLTLSLMCSFGLFITEKNKILKVLYFITYGLIGYNLILNDTLGCYLAVSVFLIAFFIYTIVQKQYRIVTIVSIIVFIILSCIITKNDKNIVERNLKGLIFDTKSIASKITNKNFNQEDNKLGNNIENIDQEKIIEKNFNKAGTSRMALWKHGSKFALESPIIGYGPENLEKKYAKKNIAQDRPHNLLIQLATTSGIPGMILYITAVGIIVIRGFKKLKSENKQTIIFFIIVLTYLISAMFGNSMYYTSPYFFIFLGFLMHCNLDKENIIK